MKIKFKNKETGDIYPTEGKYLIKEIYFSMDGNIERVEIAEWIGDRFKSINFQPSDLEILEFTK